MINSGLGNIFALLALGTMAAFGYYNGFMALLTFHARLPEEHVVSGRSSIGQGLLQLAGAIAASSVAVFFYFSQVR